MKINEIITESASRGVEESKSDPCWKNYKQVGMKEKGGRKVPNCVPKEGVAEGSDDKNRIASKKIILKNLIKIAKEQGNLQRVQELEMELKKLDQEGVAEDWQKTNKQDKTDGMSSKAVKAYRRENPGSKLKTAVTKKPSKLKAGSKDANRRKSFCARMSGNKGPMKDEKGRPTPKAKALKRWNCNEDTSE